jgi:hypothetical protein
MTGNLVQDWPIYVFGGAVLFFFIYMIVKSDRSGGNKKKI